MIVKKMVKIIMMRKGSDCGRVCYLVSDLVATIAQSAGRLVPIITHLEILAQSNLLKYGMRHPTVRKRDSCCVN